MKKCINGVFFDMAPKEIAEMERQQAELPPPEPTPEERITALEKQNAMLLDCLLEVSEIIYA